MQSEVEASQKVAHHQSLTLQVRYIAAREPFINPQVDEAATLASIKPTVLAFFKLSEGASDGGTKSYSFAADGAILSNEAVTIGSLSHGKQVVKLDLIERFEQG